MAFYVAGMKGRCERAVKRQEAAGLDEGGARGRRVSVSRGQRPTASWRNTGLECSHALSLRVFLTGEDCTLLFLPFLSMRLQSVLQGSSSEQAPKFDQLIWILTSVYDDVSNFNGQLNGLDVFSPVVSSPGVQDASIGVNPPLQGAEKRPPFPRKLGR